MERITNEELEILSDMSDSDIENKMGLAKFIRRLSDDLIDARAELEKAKARISFLESEGARVGIEAGTMILNSCNNTLSERKRAEKAESVIQEMRSILLRLAGILK